MESFHRSHIKLLEQNSKILHRYLMDVIDWSDRVICIKGFRSVGKTSFLLDLIKTKYANDKTALYVDLNNFYFTQRSIYSFIDEFVKTGGKVLILDQLHKYISWEKELKTCYEKFKELKIIFTVSTVVEEDHQFSSINDFVTIYELNGLSFREYINFNTDQQFSSYTFDEVINNHIEIAKEITGKIKPLAYFSQYVREGYYPYFHKKDSHYKSRLLKQVNLSLEIDVPYINQIELKYLPKLRKLLFILANEAPVTPNVSKLASDVKTSRATVMNYLHYLEKANLINLLQSNGDESITKKPDKIYISNTNLLRVIAPNNMTETNISQTFFYNQVNAVEKVNSSEIADFRINKRHFHLDESKSEITKDCWNVINMLEVGNKRTIPLWIFGFLY